MDKWSFASQLRVLQDELKSAHLSSDVLLACADLSAQIADDLRTRAQVGMVQRKRAKNSCSGRYWRSIAIACNLNNDAKRNGPPDSTGQKHKICTSCYNAYLRDTKSISSSSLTVYLFSWLFFFNFFFSSRFLDTIHHPQTSIVNPKPNHSGYNCKSDNEHNVNCICFKHCDPQSESQGFGSNSIESESLLLLLLLLSVSFIMRNANISRGESVQFVSGSISKSVDANGAF